MSYNWKCCSFYPNNFGASALRPVNDGKIFKEKRNDQGLSMIMKKFRHSVRSLRIHPFAKGNFYEEIVLRSSDDALLAPMLFVYNILYCILRLL